MAPLRSLYYLMREVRAELRRSPTARQADAWFAMEDPWRYESDLHCERFATTLALLERHLDASIKPAALEIGCAEGRFTRLLADRVSTLVAADLSAVALRRAGNRCAGKGNVRFAQWDLVRDAPPGQFDLVVAMDVLEYLERRCDLVSSARKIVAMMRPGAMLLVSFTRANPVIESAAWGAWLLRGSRAYQLFLHDSDLAPCITSETSTHLVAILRKKT